MVTGFPQKMRPLHKSRHAAARTLPRVASDTISGRLSAREIVAVEKPVAFATSSMVAMLKNYQLIKSEEALVLA